MRSLKGKLRFEEHVPKGEVRTGLMVSYGTVFFFVSLVVTGVLSGQVFNAFLGTLLLPKNNDLDIKNGSGTVFIRWKFYFRKILNYQEASKFLS